MVKICPSQGSQVLDRALTFYHTIPTTLVDGALIPFLYDKTLDWTKLKACADIKINLNEKLRLGFRRVENIVGKGENADYQHFSFSHNVFKSLLFQGR